MRDDEREVQLFFAGSGYETIGNHGTHGEALGIPRVLGVHGQNP